MIIKHGTVTITEDSVTMDGFWFDEDNQPVNDAAKWAISKLQELLGNELPTGIVTKYPGWIEI